MHYWWVNQNRTYKHEIPGGFLWSPKTKTNGARNQFYDNMQEVQPSDVVFSFYDKSIKAVGIVTGIAKTAPKPDFGTIKEDWEKEGWLVPVEFKELEMALHPKDYIKQLRPHLPEKYSPLQDSGIGYQHVYLAALPDNLAAEIISLLGKNYDHALHDLLGRVDTSSAEEALEESIRGRTDIGATTKAQLIQARRGQGVFKDNLRRNEKSCRVTGVSDPNHLRASHIKPWSQSTDEEKLNGCNGLLLAPHIDHLFDEGFISFSDSGSVIISRQLDRQILSAWGVPEDKNVGKFNEQQMTFLTYHRNKVFKK